MPSLTRPALSRFGDGAQPCLRTAGGVRLRPWRSDDAAAVRAVYGDAAVQRWHVRSLGSDDEARELVLRWRAGWADGREACWAVVRAQDDGLLARVAVKVADPDGVGELAYWTAPAARGRGVAPAAVEAASAWAFAVGFHRLELVHSAHNPPSCRVAEKAGFEAEGVLRESVLHADGWHDMHLHARLAEVVQPTAR